MADTRIEPVPPLTEGSYVPRPTRWTLFLRTFVPWQMVRFVVINMKMIGLTSRSHAGLRR